MFVSLRPEIWTKCFLAGGAINILYYDLFYKQIGYYFCMGLDDAFEAGNSRRITLDFSPESFQILTRLRDITGLDYGDMLRCSLTAFKILITAYENGAEVYYQVPGRNPVKIAKPY